MGREAFERSVSSAQNRSKPPPVPEMPTVTSTSGFCPLKFSGGAGGERPDGAGAVGEDRLATASTAAAGEQAAASRQTMSAPRTPVSLAVAAGLGGPRPGYEAVTIR